MDDIALLAVNEEIREPVLIEMSRLLQNYNIKVKYAKQIFWSIGKCYNNDQTLFVHTTLIEEAEDIFYL